MSELGIDTTSEQPKVLTTGAAQASDVVITIACPTLSGVRYDDWKLDVPASQGISWFGRPATTSAPASISV